MSRWARRAYAGPNRKKIERARDSIVRTAEARRVTVEDTVADGTFNSWNTFFLERSW